MNRYLSDLIDTGKAMQELAEKLDNQRAQPLTPSERELVRLAVAPRLRMMLNEMQAMFTRGVDLSKTSFLGDVSQMFDDLKN